MASLIERLKRIPARLLMDPLEDIWPRIAAYPRVGKGIPDGYRLYVIGDVHGRIDLLRMIHTKIVSDLTARGPGVDCRLIYLGDYIDGGPWSREVIEALIGDAPAANEKIALMGNHERLLLDFLNDPSAGEQWLNVYGRATLESYGITAPEKMPLGLNQLADLRSSLRANIPKSHLEFIRSLRPYYVFGDYAFVHAGIRPGLPVSDQSLEDLLSIRSEFVSSRLKHEKIIVHGHTYSRRPQIRAYRIGIDTGSFMTGNLTCLVLERDTYRFL